MIYVFGSGGLALCVVDAFLSQGEKNVTVVTQAHEQQMDIPCLSILESKLKMADVKQSFVAVGDNFNRQKLTQKLLAANSQMQFVNAIHHSVVLGTGARLGNGIYIGACTSVGPQVAIGSHSIINAGVTIEHNSTLGEYLNIGTGSSIAGTVQIGDRSILGVNTAVLHNISVGADALLASSACITKHVEPGTVMMGVPAVAKKSRKFGDAYL